MFLFLSLRESPDECKGSVCSALYRCMDPKLFIWLDMAGWLHCWGMCVHLGFGSFGVFL